MIYLVLVTSVSFPEPLFERKPGIIDRNIDTAALSVAIQQAGEQKLKYIQIGHLTASIFQEGEYVGLVVHDGDKAGAENLGKGLRKYFRELLEKGELPNEEELRKVIAYYLLPTAEEIGELLNALKGLEAEAFFHSRHVYERVSLFTALSSAFKRAIRPMKREDIIKSFFEAKFKTVNENVVARLEDDLMRAIFAKSSILSYVSAPERPVVDPEYVRREISKISNSALREVLDTLLLYTLGKKSYGDLCDVVAKHREEIERLLKGEHGDVYAAVLVYPSKAERLYEQGKILLKDKSEYFYTFCDSLIDTARGLELIVTKDYEAIHRFIDEMREKFKAVISSGKTELRGFRLYVYMLSEYYRFLISDDNVEENYKSALKLAALIPSSINPLVASYDVPTLSYTRTFPATRSLRTLMFLTKYLKLVGDPMFEDVYRIVKESMGEFLKHVKRRISAGRIPNDQMAILLGTIALLSKFLSEFDRSFDELSKSITKSLSEINVESIKGIYKMAEKDSLNRYNRAEISSHIAALTVAEYGTAYTSLEILDKAVNILERIVLYGVLDPEAVDRLTPLIPLYALLKFVYSNPVIMGSEKYATKFSTIESMVTRIKGTPIAKFVLFNELYRLFKEYGSLAEDLLVICNQRRSYREDVGGDPSIIDSLKRLK